MRKLTTLALFALCSNVAMAADNPIFSCFTDQGKTVEIKKVGNDYAFSYGNIKFKQPVQQVFKNEDTKIDVGSGFISSSVEMINKGVSYTVSFGKPKGNSNELIEPALRITKNGNTDYAICDTTKPVKQNFEMKKMSKSG